MSNDVEIIKAKTSIQERRKLGHKIERKRIAAYCRVSTDDSEQLNSFASQVKYYTNLINDNPEWMMAGVYSDEAISGTQVSHREGFQRMIRDAMSGEIDMVITKSISRFARNTLDTLKYVRMLKDKNIPVYFEDEKINTLSMDGELLLVVLSSVAQQEVENISNNVKKGLAMKMSRGEIVGFVKAFGYDYDPETDQISVNDEEAKIVKYIFNQYVDGIGTSSIAHELERMGVKSPRGKKTWAQTTVMGILKNEKYVGDLLQGKTFTVDPITHRRLENLGEVNQYLVRDHHTAIISRGTFDKVQEIIKKRAATHGNVLLDKDNRTITRRKYAFSSKIRCGYCGAYLSRRVWNEGNNGTKVVWECVESTKNGKEHCPYSKALPEEAIEGSFIESLRLMTQEHANILLDFVNSVDAELDLHSASRSLNHEKKILKDLNNKP